MMSNGTLKLFNNQNVLRLQSSRDQQAQADLVEPWLGDVHVNRDLLCDLNASNIVKNECDPCEEQVFLCLGS